MYAEQYGVVSTIEDLAQLVQWTDYAVSQVRAEGDDDEKKARWNAKAFWEVKAARWPGLNATEQKDAEKLDAFLKYALGRMEANLAVLADTDSESRTNHAAMALKWNEQAAQHSANAGASRLAASGANRVTEAKALPKWIDKNVPDDRASTAIMDSAKKLVSAPFLGIPAWAWIAGAAGLGLLLLSRGRE